VCIGVAVSTAFRRSYRRLEFSNQVLASCLAVQWRYWDGKTQRTSRAAVRGCVMPQIQPYPPVCPRCKKPTKLTLARESEGGRKFQCSDCGEPDPMQDVKINRWLNGELRVRK
jgi:hypothetical protein